MEVKKAQKQGRDYNTKEDKPNTEFLMMLFFSGTLFKHELLD